MTHAAGVPLVDGPGADGAPDEARFEPQAATSSPIAMAAARAALPRESIDIGRSIASADTFPS